MVRTVELTARAFESCRRRPMTILLMNLMEASPGEEIVIRGEDVFYPLARVKEIVVGEGFEIVEEKFDGIEYILRARKPHSTQQPP